MRDSNKRKREDESYYMQNVSRSHDYQEHVTYQTPVAEHNQPFNQAILLNQPVIQNQQLLYQLQRGNDQQQNLVYLLVPSNENLHVQPLTILPNDQQNRQCTNSQLNNHNKKEDELKLDYHDGVRHHKNVQYLYTTTTKDDNLSASTYQNYQKSAVLKDQGNTSKQHLYRCDYSDCSESFYSLYEKKLHLDTHIFPENNEFKCSICNMVFEKAIDRNKHVESHSISATYQCKQCRKYFTYYTSLVKHLEETKCSTKNPVSCYFCEMKIVDSEYLIKHHQLSMKRCACGLKVCGNQTFELHRNVCASTKSNQNVQESFEKKRANSRKT